MPVCVGAVESLHAEAERRPAVKIRVMNRELDIGTSQQSGELRMSGFMLVMTIRLGRGAAVQP
jgi:hypothetical protein